MYSSHTREIKRLLTVKVLQYAVDVIIHCYKNITFLYYVFCVQGVDGVVLKVEQK